MGRNKLDNKKQPVTFYIYESDVDIFLGKKSFIHAGYKALEKMIEAEKKTHEILKTKR